MTLIINFFKWIYGSLTAIFRAVYRNNSSISFGVLTCICVYLMLERLIWNTPTCTLVQTELADKVKKTERDIISLEKAFESVPLKSFDYLQLGGLVEFLTPEQMYGVLFKYISTPEYTCSENRRFGHEIPYDGGYNVCMDVQLVPGECIVYSIGIDDDWSFDEGMADYGCNVYSFDPSIGFPDHKHADRIWFYSLGLWYEDVDDQVVFNKDNVTAEHWKCRTLETIMEMLGHSKKPIDVLKFDIDNNEHLIFHQLIMSGVLKYVKQLDFGVHLDIIPRERKDLILGVYRYMKTAFDEFGFKLWFSNENTYEAEVQNFGRHAGGRRHNVMEMSWVNTNYLNLE